MTTVFDDHTPHATQADVEVRGATARGPRLVPDVEAALEPWLAHSFADVRVHAAAEDEGPEVAEAPAAEMLARAQLAQDVAMFQDERQSFMRDRIAAAARRIAIGVDELSKSPESDRPPLRLQVHAAEVELARALFESVELLTARIPEFLARVSAGEDVEAELAAARRDLRAAQGDLETLKGVFSPATGESFEETYRTKVAGLNSMAAADTGLGALISPEVASRIRSDVEKKAKTGLKRKKPVNLDQFITIMNTAHADKIAGPKQRAAWSRKHQRWAPTLESIVRARVNARVPGFYFFGFAVAEAFHSVLIGVSTWDEPRTIWCDQYGCTPVPGNLDDYTLSRLKAWEKAGIIHYHDWDSYLWQVLPPAAASLFAEKEMTP